MNFVKIPNLPQGPVKLAAIDGRINREIETGFSKLGIRLIKMKRHPGVYEAISFHPDIMLHHVGDESIVYAPGTDRDVLASLSSFGFKLIRGETELASAYPCDIAYNVARIGNFAFHNFKYTDPILKRELVRADVELVQVKQGYAKCSISVVDEKSIITGDPGIAKAAGINGMEVLLIGADKGILLPSLDRGFIGGSSGLIDKDLWALSGDLQKLESNHEICKFLSQRGIKEISLSDGPVVDIGSIMPLLA